MMGTPGNDSAQARRARLDGYADQVRAVILARQDEASGLLPASTAITVHGDYTHAWVRDNVYSILAVWALGRAYRRIDPALAAPLDDSVIRLMRGLLAAMMKQASKVERFKHTQDPLDALHAKYDTRAGEPVVGDADWGHLQLDATALFVLFLAQMSASGLAIVRSPAEVAFVQNLVHYLAKAYRTPDFGIWERGHKRNEGVAEINASSVGMAKAALEAVSGLRFIAEAPATHVQADDVAQARNTLEGLLPRESESKEIDAALLAIIGFPAFAVEDVALRSRTRADIVDKLQGRYGCKRFLRDGHQTVLEDPSRLHYEPGELGQFEHVESEWPLFFTYLLLDALLRGDAAAAADYRTRLEDLMRPRDGQRLLPELYFVPADRIDAERAHPHSQPRVPNDNLPLVWAQSLYIVGALLQDGCIDAADLDPLRRRVRADDAPHDVTLQVALLAEDELVQSRLAAQGIASATLAEVAPIRVGYAQELKAAFGRLGRNDLLGLSGRPLDRLGSLATSQVFTLGAERWVFLPSFFNRPGFYLTLDNRLLVDEISAEAAYVRRHWRQPGRPLLVLLVAEPMLDAIGSDVLLAFLHRLVDAGIEGLRAGELSALLRETGSTAIDWLDRMPIEDAPVAASAEVVALLGWEEAATRPLTTARAAALEREANDAALLAQLATSRNPYEQVEILGLLWQRRGGELPLERGGSVRQFTEAMYARASRQRVWGVLRRTAGLLGMFDETLEEAVGQIVVHRKRVSIGRSDVSGAVLARPCATAEILASLRAHGSDDTRARVLIQEVVLMLGMLIKADPELFMGTLTLRAWHLVLLINGWLAREHGVSAAEAFDHLLDLSPHAILGRLREVITREQEMTRNLQQQRWLRTSGGGSGLVRVDFPASADPALGDAEGGWHAWREMTGVITRLPEDFHARVWELLQHCRGLVIGDALDSRNRLDSDLLRADTTPAEAAFALQVDDLLNKIQEPAYRQLSIEALLALSAICRANPDLRIDGELVIDGILATAVASTLRQQPPPDSPATDGREAFEHDAAQWAQAWQAFYASEPHRVADGVMSAFALLLHAAPAQPLAA